MEQRLPSKPPYLSDSDHAFILKRDNHKCVHYGRCPRSNGSACCDEMLDFDHAQPIEYGGDNSFNNIRLLCSSINRGRAIEPLEYWAEPNYWDNQVTPGKLREVQRIAAWDAIDDLKHLLPQPAFDLRRRLLGTTTFLPGATGIGKCILAQAVFFRFNAMVELSNPRIRHVLWLTVDTTLRDTGAIELETDGEDIRFVARGPSVQIAKGFADINNGPNGSDVKISAVQSLWKVQDADDNARHTPEEIRNALAKYDTIVFDECDWGNEQVRMIAHLGSHAMQFALTATPLIGEFEDKETVKDFVNRFVLITPGAVADYKRAVEFDQCLKLLGSVKIAARHDGYSSRERGAVKDHKGTMMPDHPSYRGAILEAVISADHLETRMREADPANWYSPHIMVRMSTVAELKAMHGDLTEQLEAMCQRGLIKNLGWKCSMIYQGHVRQPKDIVSYEERELSKKDRRGKWVHPFMLARDNDGRAVTSSRRILLICNIGLRGINNWPVSHIVDNTDIESPVELVQFDEGRPMRWKSRREWVTPESKLAEFATTRIFIPTSSFEDEKRQALTRARDFVLNMREDINRVGFMTWVDLIQGGKIGDQPPNIDPSSRPLTDAEKFQVQACLANAVTATGELSPAEIGPALNQNGAFVHAPTRLRERLEAYAMRLIEKPDFREHEMTAADVIAEFTARPANVMERLHPQDEYDLDQLEQWVRNDPSYDRIRDVFLNSLVMARKTENQNDPSVRMAIFSISQRLRDTQIANYRPAARTRRLHGDKNEHGVLLEVAWELKQKLRNADQMPNEEGKVNRAMVSAAKMVFQIDDASEGGPMDYPAYHIAILGRYREKLQSLARARLISDGDLGPFLQRFANL